VVSKIDRKKKGTLVKHKIIGGTSKCEIKEHSIGLKQHEGNPGCYNREVLQKRTAHEVDKKNRDSVVCPNGEEVADRSSCRNGEKGLCGGEMKSQTERWG